MTDKNNKSENGEAQKPGSGLAAFSPLAMPISHAELAKLWDIVIRAHYLAHELNDPCARTGLAAARMALSLSEVLSNWAVMFGEELEAVEKKVANDRE